MSEDATTDTSTALEELGGEEFIFDVQTHYVNYDVAEAAGEWTQTFPQSRCPEGAAAGTAKVCFTADAYFREVYARADTSMSILSALPSQVLPGLAAGGHGLRHRDRQADRLRRAGAHARRRLSAPGPDRGRAR